MDDKRDLIDYGVVVGDAKILPISSRSNVGRLVVLLLYVILRPKDFSFTCPMSVQGMLAF